MMQSEDGMKQYQISAETNIGKVRLKNEDNIFCNGIYKRKSEKLFVHDGSLPAGILNIVGVFDGMGGYSSGSEASYIAVKQLENYTEVVRSKKLSFELETVFSRMNAGICREASRSLEKMGSTVVLWICENGKVQISNLGDSRAYLYRDGILEQISIDHTEENSISVLREQLGISDTIDISKYKNILTQHLGIEEDEFILEPAVFGPMSVRKGDIFLLCSDGLTGAVPDTDIADILNLPADIKAKKRLLIEKALKYGGKDNITVVLIEI